MSDITTTYLAVAFGYWGKGPTEATAVAQCRRAGAKKSAKTIIYQNDVNLSTLGPERLAAAAGCPYVDDSGCTAYYGTLTKIAEYNRGKRADLTTLGLADLN